MRARNTYIAVPEIKPPVPVMEGAVRTLADFISDLGDESQAAILALQAKIDAAETKIKVEDALKQLLEEIEKKGGE